MTTDISTNIDAINSMTDAEAKEYFEDLQDDYWIEEYKNML